LEEVLAAGIFADMLRTKIFETSVAARISRPRQEAGEKSGLAG